MSRGNYHAYFDEKIFEDYVEIVGRGNIKRNLEEYMMNVIATTNKNIDGINIKLLNIEIENLTKKLSKIKSALDSKVAIKQKFEEKANEVEMERLNEEKKRLEESEKCKICGKIVKDKSQMMMNGQLCKGCYMTTPPSELRKYE